MNEQALTSRTPRPEFLVEQRTDAMIEMRAEEYLGRRLALEHVKAHVPWYTDPDGCLTFEIYLEWVTEWHETDRRLLIDRRAARI